MWLNFVWYVLFVTIISGYLILDGFDLGVGILHMVLAKNDTERRIMINSIGPIWDGNEVWLVVGGGVLFAAFPLVYASLFSGFYVAMMLILLVLILRTVAIEFRSKRMGHSWRTLWDVTFSLSSLLIALLFGVAFGNIIGGVPLDAEQNIRMSLFDMLTPFTLLVGFTTVVMMAMHGAIYLTMKVEGALLVRVKSWLPKLMVAFFLFNTVVVLAVLFGLPYATANYISSVSLAIFPAIALVALLAAWWLVRKENYFKAFLASSAMIALLLFSGAVSLYPNLLVSTIDTAYNLTIYNGAAATNSLVVMLIIALIGMPFVVVYTAGVYYFFRGKVELTAESY
jgi:cytochrome d ubiquinol oxidase subunit II